MRAAIVAVLLVTCPVAGAWAHVTSTGVAVLDVEGSRLTYRLTLVAPEQEEEIGRVLLAAGGGDADAMAKVSQAARDYARFSVDGTACTPGQATVLGPSTPGVKVMLEIALACPKVAGTLLIRDDWPEVLGGHVQIVMSVRIPGRRPVEFAFLDDRRSATVELSGTTATGWLGFIAMGAEHILSGPDHLLFLLALLALARGFWPIVKIVTGFTIAHSITLSLAALGVVEVPSRIVEPLIAATIVWVAVENLAFPGGARWRWLIAAMFGLIHGGWASPAPSPSSACREMRWCGL